MAGTYSTNLLRADDTAAFEHLKMLEDRRQRHRKWRGQLRYARGPAAEPLDDPPPGRIGKRLKQTVDVLGLVRHRLNYPPDGRNSQAKA